VELQFGGPAPALGFPGETRDDGRLLIPAGSDDPAATAAEALLRLRPDHPPLAGLEVVHPTLESVYLAVTGRRFSADAEPDEEVDDVAVA
jgi:ABC-2 type transport system ATP-binding protein